MKKIVDIVRLVLAIGSNAVAKGIFGIGYIAMVVFIIVAAYCIGTHVQHGYVVMEDDLRIKLLFAMCAVGALLIVGLGGEMWTNKMVTTRRQALACI